VLDPDKADGARAFLQTPFNEMQPRISPDGRWIAYTSDETGSWEVYVQSFPSPGAKRAVSLNGGTEPLWTKGGEELVYLRPDGTLVAVRMSADGAAMLPSLAQPLFRVPLAGDIMTYRNNYVVTADGSRFLVDTADESTREPINVVVHWESLLAR
jgi:eukaryotic-like serine/threonine-protein kinase